MSSLHVDGSNKRIANVFWPFLVVYIILASEVAAICALNFYPLSGMYGFGREWQNWLPFLIAAPLASLLVGLPIWRFFAMSVERVTVKRGILLGGLVSMVAHPVMWIGIELYGILWDVFTHQPFSAISFSLGLMLYIILISLIYVGWMIAIVGGIAGALLVYLQRALMRDKELPDSNAQGKEIVHEK